MSDFPGEAFFAAFQMRIAEDPEMRVIGDWFDTAFSLTFGENRWILRVEKGRIPLLGRRRRIPDPPLDLGTVRRSGRAARSPEGRTGPDRRRNLGRLRPQRLGLRVSRAEDSPKNFLSARHCRQKIS